jgi:uncharacterized protein YycO
LKKQRDKEEAAIVHYYPNTSLQMMPGDILYSHKYAFSSFLVGHTAIIGMNFRIYHVNRWQPLGHSDSMPIYLSRHKKSEKLTILRHDNQEEAKQAAIWAMQYYDDVKQYTYNRDLNNLTDNYCSKFTWQAFYFGTNGKVDLLQKVNRKSLTSYIMPGMIYRRLTTLGTFKNRLMK